MTLDEANACASKLTDLNVKYWDATNYAEKMRFKNEFSRLYDNIVHNGFKIRRVKILDWTYNRRVPHFKIREDKNSKFISYENNRPQNLKIKNDCTTRCISYCTGIDYMQIRNEQLINAVKHAATWRTNYVWAISLEQRGFKQFTLPKKISRAVFLKKFSNKITTGIFATHSSGHIAAIDMVKKQVIDTWDSTGGRIDYMYIHESQYETVKNIINAEFKVSKVFKI